MEYLDCGAAGNATRRFFKKNLDGTPVYYDPISEEVFKKLQQANALKNKMNK
jgi:hypothetical protein